MKCPNALVILPVCEPDSNKVSSVVRFRSWACRETSDVDYRVSLGAELSGTIVGVSACFRGTGA